MSAVNETDGPTRPLSMPRLANVLAPLVEKLRARPGEWRIVRHYPSRSGAYMSMKSAAKSFPDLEFEAHVCPKDPADPYRLMGSDLWARCPKPTPQAPKVFHIE